MAFAEIVVTRALIKLANDPQAIGRFLNILDSPMPNIETATMGGHMFWKTIANVDGWRLQENIIFGNCRIIDPKDIRKAWGGKQAILKAFEEI